VTLLYNYVLLMRQSLDNYKQLQKAEVFTSKQREQGIQELQKVSDKLRVALQDKKSLEE
jgi:hypothetical protein